MDAKSLALGTHLLGTIRGACPEPSPEPVEGPALSPSTKLGTGERCVAIRVEGLSKGLSMGLTPEKQDHSPVVEPSLVKAMALLKGMTVLEVAAEKGIRGDNRVLVDLVGGVAQVMREVEYPAGLDAMTAWEKSMAPMDI